MGTYHSDLDGSVYERDEPGPKDQGNWDDSDFHGEVMVLDPSFQVV